MSPYHQDQHLTVWQGDCREVMAQMPAESVHTVVTSPPYWGLRDYGTATWIGGDDSCDHKQADGGHLRDSAATTRGGANKIGEAQRSNYRDACRKCGAIRQDSQLGLEATPEEYVENMVAVFREVRRVLRADGTCWVNLGDSYNGSGKGGNGGPSSTLSLGRRAREDADYRQGFHNKPIDVTGLKPKNLVGIPWRVAFALQADGLPCPSKQPAGYPPAATTPSPSPPSSSTPSPAAGPRAAWRSVSAVVPF